jgi:hypothetical protein
MTHLKLISSSELKPLPVKQLSTVELIYESKTTTETIKE